MKQMEVVEPNGMVAMRDVIHTERMEVESIEGFKYTVVRPFPKMTQDERITFTIGEERPVITKVAPTQTLAVSIDAAVADAVKDCAVLRQIHKMMQWVNPSIANADIVQLATQECSRDKFIHIAAIAARAAQRYGE